MFYASDGATPLPYYYAMLRCCYLRASAVELMPTGYAMLMLRCRYFARRHMAH